MGLKLALRSSIVILALLASLPLVRPGIERASAQTMPGSEPGIVAAGFGRVSRPAATADVQIIVSQDPYGMMGYVETVPAEESFAASPAADEAASSDAGFAPYTPVMPPALTEDDLAAIIEVVVNAGVARDEIQFIAPAFSSMFTGPGGPGGAQLRFSIVDPTLEGVATLVKAASEATFTAGLAVQHVGVHYTGNDCAAMEQEARVLAVVDARARAEGLAAALDTTLGELTQAVDGFYYGIFGTNECGPVMPEDYGQYGPGMLEAFDASAPAEAVAYAQVTLTFAMAPNAVNG